MPKVIEFINVPSIFHLKRVFPAPWLTALSAFKAYYAALELMRDYLVIPAFHERLYQAYKRQRAGTGGASPADAFTEATVLPASGYYLVKPSMLDKYIKARGWQKDVVGEKVLKDAEHRIDDFWQKRLEARYQKDLAAAQAGSIGQTMWAAQANNLAVIRAAAEKYGGAYPYFLTREDVDALEGWKFSQSTYWPPPPTRPDMFRPRKESGTDMVLQGFNVLPKGFTEKKDKDGFPVCYGRDGKPVRAPYLHVTIQADPRMMSGVYNGKPYTYDQLEGEKNLSQYDKHPVIAFSRELKEPGMVYGHLLRKALKNGTASGKLIGYIVRFFTDKLRITIGVQKTGPFDAPDTETLALQVARVMLRKMGK